MKIAFLALLVLLLSIIAFNAPTVAQTSNDVADDVKC